MGWGRAMVLVCAALGLAAGLARAARAAEPKVYPTVSLAGYFMADAAFYDSDDADLNGGAEMRRARVTVNGHVEEDWFYRLQYELTESGSSALCDVYVGYSGLGDTTWLRAGHVQEAGDLEDAGSSKNVTFMERALPVLAFVPAEWRMGGRVDTWGADWTLAVGLYGENAGMDSGEEGGAGSSARLCYAPVHGGTRVLHGGVFGAYRLTPGSDTVRFRARPEAHVDDTRFVDTGTISNATAYAMGGLEAAWVAGPFSLQGEWMAVDVEREAGEDPLFDGYYVYASWFLTGESRPYDAASGTFGRIVPLHPLGRGGLGAWEVGVRYSTLDLQDVVRGGDERNITAGVNWHPGPRVRMMLNYVNIAASTDDGDVDAHVVQLRTQVEF